MPRYRELCQHCGDGIDRGSLIICNDCLDSVCHRCAYESWEDDGQFRGKCWDCHDAELDEEDPPQGEDLWQPEPEDEVSDVDFDE